MAAQRQAQNAADAAAQAAAFALQIGDSHAVATTAANNMVTANGLPASPAPTVNIPPKSGNYVGQTGYAEVIVSYPVSTVFIQLLGVAGSHTATARAVAGSISQSSNLGIILLNPKADPGLSLSGNGVLKVSDPSGALGGISVYSMYGGETQVPGVTVNFPGYSGGDAVNVSGNGTIDADFVDVSGGVNNRNAFTAGTLTAGTGNAPVNPLASLPTPTVSNGVTPIYWGQNSNGTFAPAGYWNGTTWIINTLKNGSYTGTYTSSSTAPTPLDITVAGNSTATIPPGIYGSISLSGNSDITFGWDPAVAPPGFTSAPATNIYVLTGETTSDLTISGNSTITGSNMMFYNTGTKYNPLTGDNGSTQFGSTISPAIPASFIPRPPRALREHLVLPEPAEHFSHELLWQ